MVTSTFEEPGAQKGHAGICAGAVWETGRPTAMVASIRYVFTMCPVTSAIPTPGSFRTFQVSGNRVIRQLDLNSDRQH